MKEIELLKKLLQKNPSAKIYIAMKLNLTSTTTVDKWIYKNALPKKKRELILAVMADAA